MFIHENSRRSNIEISGDHLHKIIASFIHMHKKLWSYHYDHHCTIANTYVSENQQGISLQKNYL